MPEPRHLIVDTDTGIDDALALIYLAAQPEVSIEAVTAVYGNCTVEDSLLNIAHVLGMLGLDGVPVARGAAGPLEGEAHIAHYVHGRDGMGDVVAERRMPAGLVEESAADMLVRLANEKPGHYELIALGPLTNLGLALRKDPELLTKFRSVAVMGGSGPFPALGEVEMVDANVQNDGTAAELVFRAPAARRLMVGVNVTIRAIVDEEHVVALHRSGTQTGAFAASVLESYMDFYRLAWGRRVSPAHDGLTAALLLHPEWITGQVTGPATITFDGFATRARIMRTHEGRPVAWPVEATPETIAVTDVDYGAFLEAFVDALISGRRSRA